MLITHKITLDMMHPDTPPRIQVKQGDTLSRALEVTLLCDGEPWLIPEEITPLVRWQVCHPGTGEMASGIYDTLPDGNHAWNYSQNQLDLVLAPQMFTLPGLVQADVALVTGEKALATFNFEFYVNPSPADGTESQAQSYYKVATLDQLNTQLVHLETLITELREDIESANSDLATLISNLQAGSNETFAHLEHEIDALKRIVYEM